MPKNFKPGESVPRSGLYEVIGPRGGDTHKEVTVSTKDGVFPPTPKPGMTYRPSRLAHNKSGKR